MIYLTSPDVFLVETSLFVSLGTSVSPLITISEVVVFYSWDGFNIQLVGWMGG